MTVTLVGSGTTQVAATANEDVFILTEGSYRTIESQPALTSVNFSSVTFIIDGSATRIGSFASSAVVYANSASDEASVFVNETGSVFSNTAIYLEGQNSSVVNHGVVNGINGGIRVTDGDVANFGTVSVTATFATAIQVSNTTSTVNNLGDVSGYSGVFAGGANSNVTNAGTISAIANGITLLGTNSDITNTGTITSGGIGLNLDGANQFVQNFGTISGAVNSIEAAFLADGAEVINSGTLVGDVLMTGGEQEIRNSGLIDGEVNLAGGEDIYRGIGDGVTTGIVLGNNGDDLLIGGALSDHFDGGDDDDTLRGQDGDDVLEGGNGVDLIFGGTGEDALLGGTGEDTLRGGDDNDILQGGADQDILFGNAGADAFVYVDALDSTDDANRDLIRDFTNGEDVIDLSAFAGAFTFIGSSGFSGTGGSEVRFIVNAGGNAVVRVDVDGDGLTDMRILVQGTDTLTENDFVL